MDNSFTFYRFPNPTKKKSSLQFPVKNPENCLKTLQETDDDAARNLGLLWGGSIWVGNEQFIKALIENGCYGNSIMSRSVTASSRKEGEQLGMKESVYAVERKVVEEERKESMDEKLTKKKEKQIEVEETKEEENVKVLEGRKEISDSPPRKKQKLDMAPEDTPSFFDEQLIDSSCNTLTVEHVVSNMSSYLHLFPEEAFHLARNSCLNIHDKEGSVISLEALQEQFEEEDNRFMLKYIAYVYFRSKGWIPKCGLKFGVDFLLYKCGPPFYHSSFAVIVQEDKTKCIEKDHEISQTSESDSVKENGGKRSLEITSERKEISTEVSTLGEGRKDEEMIQASLGSKDTEDSEVLLGFKERTSKEHSELDYEKVCSVDKETQRTENTDAQTDVVLTWQDIVSLGRVNESAKKDLMICYIGFPNSDEKINEKRKTQPLTVPDLSSISVSCVIVKRWIIDKDR